MDKSAFHASAATALECTYALFGIAAVYTPNGGFPQAVTLLVDSYTASMSTKQGTRSRITTLRGSIRVSEVTQLQRGDTFQLDDETAVCKLVPESLSMDGLQIDFEAVAEAVLTVGHVQTFPDR